MKALNDYRILAEGDSCALIAFGGAACPETSRRISSAARRIRDAKIAGIADMIPAYISLLVQYDPTVLSFDALRARLGGILRATEEGTDTPGRVFEIPVCYGGEFGPDLENIASHAGMTEREVIDLHTSAEYLIYMLGFLPGFCYLGGLDERIHTPRLQTPRLKIPAGSVGIGGSQTGIYPLESPGGWQLMGRTPVRMYDPERETPILVQAGDSIRFTEIGAREYERIREAVEKNEYRVTVREGGA